MALATRKSEVTLGIYEKALNASDLNELFKQVADLGFSFVDLSVDEDPVRIARLDWTAEERAEAKQSAVDAGISIGGICLSVHRKFGPGSNDPTIRAKALELLIKGIDLCADLGIPVLQIAGYYAYYEESTSDQRDRYLETLHAGLGHAAKRGVRLGLENVDGTDVTSIDKAEAIIDEMGSPWFGLYPDIGNFVVQGLDPLVEVKKAIPLAMAFHVKDARLGVPRRVLFGEGLVPWAAVSKRWHPLVGTGESCSKCGTTVLMQ